MAIKFIPQEKGVVVEGEEAFKSEMASLLACMINGLHRVELQLETLTGDAVEQPAFLRLGEMRLVGETDP